MLYSASPYHYSHRSHTEHMLIYATRMEQKEERTIRKREDKGNRKNNHKRREIYECRHSRHN